jgi:hypothetical protein
MTTSAVHSSPVTKNEGPAKPAPRQNPASQPAAVPQDKVTLSPQAQARVQAQAQAQQTPSANKSESGGKA